MACHICGGCCEFLAAAYTKKEFKDLLSFTDWKFVEKHWHEIKWRRPANRLMPPSVWVKLIQYRCDCFDPVTKLCTDYENRPEMCRRYPPPDECSLTLLCDRCGYMK